MMPWAQLNLRVLTSGRRDGKTLPSGCEDGGRGREPRHVGASTSSERPGRDSPWNRRGAGPAHSLTPAGTLLWDFWPPD